MSWLVTGARIVNSKLRGRQIPMILEYQVVASQTISLGLVEDESYDLIVDWGDGSAYVEVTSWDDADASHIYTEGGTYIVRVWGSATHWSSLNQLQATRDSLIRVKSIGNLGWTSLSYAFYNCTNLQFIAGGRLNNVTTIESMARNCYSLSTVDSAGWYLPNCETVRDAFRNCELLTTRFPDHLFLTNLSILDGDGIFNNAKLLANWHSMPTDWKYSRRLEVCWDLPEENMPVKIVIMTPGVCDLWIDWGDGTEVQHITEYDSVDLTHTYSDIGYFHALVSGSATTIGFYNGDLDDPAIVNNIVYLTDIPSVGDLSYTNLVGSFAGLQGLQKVCGGYTQNVTSLFATFSNDYSLTDIDLSTWDTSNVTNMNATFYNVGINPFTKLKSASRVDLDISHFDVSNVTQAYRLFANSIINPITTNWVFSSLTNGYEMFAHNQEAIDTDTSTWAMPLATNLACMFADTKYLNPNISNWVGPWTNSRTLNIRMMMFNAQGYTGSETGNGGFLDVTNHPTSFSNIELACLGVHNAPNYTQLASNGLADRTFKLTFDITTPNTTVQLGLDLVAGNYDFYIDAWGDETTTPIPEHIFAPVAAVTHTYVEVGVYTCVISTSLDDGSFTHFNMVDYSDATSRQALIGCSIGDVGLTNLHNGFKGCTNFTNVKVGMTNNVTDFSNLFDATTLNPDHDYEMSMNYWQLDSALTTAEMFRDIMWVDTPVTTVIDGWRLPVCTNVTSMFHLCQKIELAPVIPSGLFWNNNSITTYDFCFFMANTVTSHESTPVLMGGGVVPNDWKGGM